MTAFIPLLAVLIAMAAGFIARDIRNISKDERNLK